MSVLYMLTGDEGQVRVVCLGGLLVRTFSCSPCGHLPVSSCPVRPLCAARFSARPTDVSHCHTAAGELNT